MAKPLLPDELWDVIKPLIPPEPDKPRGGRPRISDRAALTGILFVLRTGIPWEYLPQEMGCGSGMTCWRRLRDWHRSGVWVALHRALLERLAGADKLNWTRASVDSASVAAPKGGAPPHLGGVAGPDPTNRGKKGTKRHIVVDGHGTPPGMVISASNVHDSKMLEAVLDDVPPIGNGRVGRPRRRADKVHADKGYDYRRCREAIRRRGGRPRIARRGVESSERLGRQRWMVERTLSWLNGLRRLKVRYERREDIHLAFVRLGCALVTFNQLQRLC